VRDVQRDQRPDRDRTIEIAGRFEGPTGFAQGGYTAGVVVGERYGHDIGQYRAGFHTPIPLDRPLERRATATGALELWDEERLVVRVVPSTETIPDPPSTDLATAEAARLRYPPLGHETVPACFSCGAGTESFRVWAGPIGAGEYYATPWTPPEWTAPAGIVELPYIWAAIDCPAGAKICHDGSAYRRALTGSMTAEILAPVRPEQPHVLVAWAQPWRGRRRVGGVSMFDLDGGVVARQTSMWIAVPA
jgi:hypothetical protein